MLAQSFVNPGFTSGSTGWTGCALEINPANVYGGPNTDPVAEVDGHNDPNSPADDRLLCQTISGFTVGAVYALEFEATRRQTGPTPASVSVTVRIDNVLEQVVTRTGAWNMVREHFVFVPTASSHSLSITPNFSGSHGMLFDNFSFVVVSPLPVELVGFEARSVGDDVQLEWTTATEHNNAGFTVQRSTDLFIWEPVTHLPGAVNSQTPITYRACDTAPRPGLAYYRLEQVDTDGARELSDVRAVVHEGRKSLLLWPNPADAMVNVSMADVGLVMVSDAQGRQVHVEQEQRDGGVVLHVAGLRPGRYQVHTGHPDTPAEMFIKE
jgi:hypothetical protein